MSICRILVPSVEKNIFEPLFANPKEIQETVGTGFCVEINQQKWIITCAHVVRYGINTQEISIYIDGRPYQVSLHTYCPDRDVAILTNIPDDAIPCVIGDHELQPLDPLVVKGFPMGFTDMMIRDCKYNGKKDGKLQMDGAINPGDSGAPVFDAEGKVVGMITSGIPKANEITWALPINVILTLQIPCSVVEQHRPELGIEYHPITDDWCTLHAISVHGVRITEIYSFSVLKQVAKIGDIMTKINHQSLDNQGLVGSMHFEYVFADQTQWSVELYRPSTQQVLTWKGALKGIACKHTTFYFAGMCVIEHCECDDIQRLYEKYNAQPNSLLITYITSGSPAGQFGILKKGDAIQKVNTIAVSSLKELRKAMKQVLAPQKNKVYIQWDTVCQKQHAVLLDHIMKWEELTSHVQHYQPDALFDHFSHMCPDHVCHL